MGAARGGCRRLMSPVDGTVWFAAPTFFTPLDLREDADDRVRRMVSATPTLDDDERLNLIAQQEVLVERMRQGRIRCAATSAVRIEDDGPPRLSVGQLTIMVDETDVSEHVLDAIGRQLRTAGRSATGFVDLPAGRALVVVDRRHLHSQVSISGRPRRRVHVVHQVQLMLASPQRRHLVILALGTECVQDTGFSLDVMGTIGRSVSFSPPRPSTDGAASAISAALDPTSQEDGTWEA